MKTNTKRLVFSVYIYIYDNMYEYILNKYKCEGENLKFVLLFFFFWELCYSCKSIVQVTFTLVFTSPVPTAL